MSCLIWPWKSWAQCFAKEAKDTNGGACSCCKVRVCITSMPEHGQALPGKASSPRLVVGALLFPEPSNSFAQLPPPEWCWALSAPAIPSAALGGAAANLRWTEPPPAPASARTGRRVCGAGPGVSMTWGHMACAGP